VNDSEPIQPRKTISADDIDMRPATDWKKVERRNTREAIYRVASYAAQSLAIACKAAYPVSVMYHRIDQDDLIPEIETFIREKLLEVNEVNDA
jgi:hypothetical protein